tara:strand:+ start:1521 stop:1916 length:396 start_codon:yes stop_codon:yes gene_type:complete
MTSFKESEKWLERTHAKKLKELGGKSIKLECNFEAGLPDRLCITRTGLHYYIEFKSKGKKPSKIQEVRIKELRALNCDVYVIDNEWAMVAVLRLGEKSKAREGAVLVSYCQTENVFSFMDEEIFNTIYSKK